MKSSYLREPIPLSCMHLGVSRYLIERGGERSYRGWREAGLSLIFTTSPWCASVVIVPKKVVAVQININLKTLDESV